MSKICPNCGKTLPESAKFCMDCGHVLNDGESPKKSSIFSNGKIFIVIIAAILIIGAIFIMTSGGGNGTDKSVDEIEHVNIEITDVLGYDSHYDNKTSYTLYTRALFLNVPSDLNGYVIKTSYLDENGTVLGQETEKLSQVYYDTDYSISFGHYDSYKKLDYNHVNVEIIKDGKVVDNFTARIDKNKIDFLS